MVKIKNLELDIPPSWTRQLSRYITLRPRNARGLLEMPRGFYSTPVEIKLTIDREYMTPAR